MKLQCRNSVPDYVGSSCRRDAVINGAFTFENIFREPLSTNA